MNTYIFRIPLLCLCVASALGQTTSVPVAPPQYVTVTSSVEPLPLVDSDRSVRIFDLIDPRDAGLYVSPEDILRLDSSVGLQERASGGVQADVSIRDTTFEQSLVLVDGLRLNDPETGHLNLDLPIPLEGFSSIDVLHGSGSTFYGSDAIGGAVNFITQQPSRSEVAIRVGGGTFNATEQHLRADWVNQSHGFLKAEKLTSSSLNQSFPTIRSYQSASSGRIGQCAPAFVAFLATLAMCFQ